MVGDFFLYDGWTIFQMVSFIDERGDEGVMYSRCDGACPEEIHYSDYPHRPNRQVLVSRPLAS